jgi:hypothetical protein
MNSTDRVLDYVQRKVELDGRSHLDCVYLNDLQFTVERNQYAVPTAADVMAAAVDVDWFFTAAKKRMVVSHPSPDISFWVRTWGRDALPYGYTWDVQQLLENLQSDTAWRQGMLYNPVIPSAPSCVTCYQFTPEGNNLHCSVSVRSSDVYKVLPQEVAMTDLILKRIAAQIGMAPGRLTFNLGNAHCFYSDMEYVEEYLLHWGN